MIEQLLKKEIYCIAYKNGPAFARPVAVLKNCIDSEITLGLLLGVG
jgi:hypothetical protein